MPLVAGKHYPYTKKGKAAAKKARKMMEKGEMPMRAEMQKMMKEKKKKKTKK